MPKTCPECRKDSEVNGVCHNTNCKRFPDLPMEPTAKAMLDAQLYEFRQDMRRLDWLAQQMWFRQALDWNTSWQVGVSVRDGIDDAMRETEPR